MIQQTSLDAYFGIGDLKTRQGQVYLALKELREANNLMLSRKLGLPINTITPRVLELRTRGLVKDSMIKPCPFTGRRTMFWRLANEN